MKRFPIGLWIALATAMTGWCAWRLAASAGILQHAEREAAATQRACARVVVLRGEVRGVAAGRRPDGDLIARVQRALTAAALPAAALNAVQPRADRQNPGSGLRVQAVQVTLRALSPAELGNWLAAWRQGEQPWRLDEVQLVHVLPAAGALATGPLAMIAADEANRYDVTLALAAPYVEDIP